MPKAVAAKNRIAEINSEIEVEAIVADVNNSNIESFVKDVDFVLDGTDNFQIRYLLNDACVKNNKTWIYGAAVSSYGTTMTIIPNETPCLRCIFEEMPGAGSAPTCDTAGVIQPIITSISAIQTTEALKILTGNFDKLHKSLIQIDVWENQWRKIKLGTPNADCETCGKRNFEFLEAENADFFTALCGRDAVQIQPQNASKIDLEKLAEKLKNLGELKLNEYLLRLNVEGYELTVLKMRGQSFAALTTFQRHVRFMQNLLESNMEKPCNCCGNIISKFENFTKEDEEKVRQEYRSLGPISSIKLLREITNSGLKEAKVWVDHSGEYVHRKTIPCPFCGELLRTEKAKQCRFCKRHWHDENDMKFLD